MLIQYFVLLYKHFHGRHRITYQQVKNHTLAAV